MEGIPAHGTLDFAANLETEPDDAAACSIVLTVTTADAPGSGE